MYIGLLYIVKESSECLETYKTFSGSMGAH